MNDSSKVAGLWAEGAALSLLLAASLMVMGNATLSPALPLLAAEFVSDPWADWLSRFLVPAPSAAVVVCAPLAGRWADRMGRRRLLLLGVALFAVAGCAGLWLPDLRWIMASRLVLGVGMALIMTAQTALLGDLFDGGRRQQMLGYLIMARNLGGLVCISAAGVLATWGARLPFAIYLLAFVVLWVIWRSLPTERTRQVPEKTSEAEGGSGGSIGWPWAVAGIALLQGLTNLTFFVMPTQVPFFLNSLGVHAPVAAGATLGSMTLAGALVAMRFARFVAALGTGGTFAVGFGIMALGYATLSYAAGLGLVLGGAACVGVGYSLVTPSFAGLMLKAAPFYWRGRASGVLTTAIFVGQLASPVLSLPAIAAWGFPVTYGVLSVLLLTVSCAWGLWCLLAGAAQGAAVTDQFGRGSGHDDR